MRLLWHIDLNATSLTQGVIAGRINGSLISMTAGSATAYSIDKLQDRGVFFIEPGEEIYTGMVIGEHNAKTILR